MKGATAVILRQPFRSLKTAIVFHSSLLFSRLDTAQVLCLIHVFMYSFIPFRKTCQTVN